MVRLLLNRKDTFLLGSLKHCRMPLRCALLCAQQLSRRCDGVWSDLYKPTGTKWMFHSCRRQDFLLLSRDMEHTVFAPHIW